jgi:two-component system sensor histidine kinase PilS (NtrC family)
MSHAGQLLAESPNLTSDDRRLTEIIRANATRVSGIIDNVQRLSRREPARLERLTLSAWTEEFQAEFCDTMQFPRSRLTVSSSDDLEVSADPDQLRQILWNLCENAIRHAVLDDPARAVEIRYGHMPTNARPYLEVADAGVGVKPEIAERIFEPFFSSGGGTGLGLFLARELAQANGATLLYEPRAGGGSIFRLVFPDRRRWEVR